MSSYPSIEQCDDFSSKLEPSDLSHEGMALKTEEMETPEDEKEPQLNNELVQDKKEPLPNSMGPNSSALHDTEVKKEPLASARDNYFPPNLRLAHKLKGLQKSRRKLYGLSKIFVKSSLYRLYNFFMDEAELSIIFKYVDQFEVYYLVSIENILYSDKLQASFSAYLRFFMSQVKAVRAKKSSFNIKAIVVKNYPGPLCDVMFVKSAGPDSVGNDAKLATGWNCILNETSSSSFISCKPLSKEISIKGISFQSGGLLEPTKANTETDSLTQTITSSKGNIQGLSKRTNKLIQDMSVPVKCDKAIKIMQVMGWTEGGLGLGEKGILEPIMPALNTIKRVGLGNAKTNKNKARKQKAKAARDGDRALQLNVMTSILELLCSDAESKTVNFPSPLHPRMTQFIYDTTTKLSSRMNPVWNGDMAELAKKALEKLEATPNMFINSYIPTGANEVVLSKAFVNDSGEIIDTDLIATQRRSDFEILLKNEFKTDLKQVLYNLALSCTGKKSKKYMQFKLSTLIYILEFARSKDMSVVISLNMIIRNEQKRYLEQVIDSINKGEKLGETIAEQKLGASIHRTIGDMHLSVETKYFAAYRMRKIYNSEKPECTMSSNTKNPENRDIPATGHVSVGNINDTSLLQDRSGEETSYLDSEPPTDNKTGVDMGTQTEQVYDEKNEADEIILTKKITKIYRVHFVPIDYPVSQITNTQVQSIQKLISSAIAVCSELPLLKYHRIEYGALVYICYDERSVKWLQQICSVFNDVLILVVTENIGSTYNFALKFSCFFDFDIYYLFGKLKLYNCRLSTSRWIVQKLFNLGEHMILIVNVDEESYNYICESGFFLYTGLDFVQFIIV